jgi:hypothetical protein
MTVCVKALAQEHSRFLLKVRTKKMRGPSSLQNLQIASGYENCQLDLPALYARVITQNFFQATLQI